MDIYTNSGGKKPFVWDLHSNDLRIAARHNLFDYDFYHTLREQCRRGRVLFDGRPALWYVVKGAPQRQARPAPSAQPDAFVGIASFASFTAQAGHGRL